PRHQQIVVGGDRAGDRLAGDEVVLTHPPSGFTGVTDKVFSDNDAQRSRAGESAKAFREVDDSPQAIAAGIALEEMGFDLFLFRGGKKSQPVVGEHCRIDRRAAAGRGLVVAQAVASMHARSCLMARWRITRTLASESPSERPVSPAEI